MDAHGDHDGRGLAAVLCLGLVAGCLRLRYLRLKRCCICLVHRGRRLCGLNRSFTEVLRLDLRLDCFRRGGVLNRRPGGWFGCGFHWSLSRLMSGWRSQRLRVFNFIPQSGKRPSDLLSGTDGNADGIQFGVIEVSEDLDFIDMIGSENLRQRT